MSLMLNKNQKNRLGKAAKLIGAKYLIN